MQLYEKVAAFGGYAVLLAQYIVIAEGPCGHRTVKRVVVCLTSDVTWYGHAQGPPTLARTPVLHDAMFVTPLEGIMY